MKDSLKRFLIIFGRMIGGIVCVSAYAAALQDLIQNGTQHFAKGDVLALFLVTLFALCLMYPFRRPILRFVYYSIAVAFYASVVLTVLSLVSRIGDGVKSFLTAPIGIKTESEVGAFGDAFVPLLLATAIVGVIYLIAKSVRGEVKDLLSASATHPLESNPATLDAAANAE
jgi:ABC-type branched-subunit amino acid transport system permease subunit